MKRRMTLILGVVLLLALVALPVAAQSFPNPGTGSTITELANKTSTAATVRVKYYNQGGGDAGNVEKPVPANGSLAINPADTPLVQGFNGAGVASSDQPLAAVVETDWTGGPGDAFQMGYYSGVSQGSSAICFPSLWKWSTSGTQIASSFSVQNTGTSAAAVSIDWTSRDGTDQGTFTDNIPVGAQHTYDVTTSPGTYNAVPNLPTTWAGSAKVTVTNGGSVAGVTVVNWGSGTNSSVARSATYNAADCAGASGATTLVVPTHFRVKAGSSESGDWLIWSAVNIQNLEGTPATVQVEYIGRNPGDPGKTFNITIPANSTEGLNTNNGGSAASAGDFTSLGAGWAGTLKITSDKAVVATVITQWRRGGPVEAGMYAASDQSTGGATKIFVPNVKRIKPSGFEKWSAVIVQNLGGSDATADIAFYDRTGAMLVNITGQTIPSGAALGYNTNNGGNVAATTFDALGTAYEGHAVVTSTNGQPLSVVLNGIDAGTARGSGTTNGIPE